LPTPAKTSPDELVGIALSLIEEGGAGAATIAAVASAAGVKGPSLYKHFADRETLLRSAEIAILFELEAVLRKGTKGDSPRERLWSMAHTYRRWGNRHPHRYGMIYSKDIDKDDELVAACLFAAQPLFEELKRAGVSDTDVLPLSRTVVAFLHGFVTMEIAGAFWLGGSVDEAFEAALETILGPVVSTPRTP
jgi:AcrR family transcriptional regulator